MNSFLLRSREIIQRKPCGFACLVVNVDFIKLKALIDDYRGHRFWVSFKTLEEKWQYPGESK